MGNQLGNGLGSSGLTVVQKGGGTITVKDEGSTISAVVQILDFVGADVNVSGSGATVTIYIPPETFESHWDSSDGTNGDQSVTDSTSRTTAYISSPDSEGSPFSTNTWAESNQASTTNTAATFTTPSTTTGWGGDAYMIITMYDADGTTVLETFTTAAITADGAYTSGTGRIVVTISSYANDGSRKKANASVAVSTDAIFTANSRAGGRYHCTAVMYTDTAADGTGPYTYTQTGVFLDTNPTTPSVGVVTMSETAGSVVTKHLSGVEYYAQNTEFTINVADIDQLNRNTAKTSGNISLNGGNYQLGTLSQSPFGSGSADFTGWTSNYNQDGVTYEKDDWAITSSSARYRGDSGSASCTPSDPWGSGSAASSNNANILIDTYGTTSSDLVEDFDDESRRQGSDWNTGATDGDWDSTSSLADGEAQIIGGLLIAPSAGTLSSGAGNTDWSGYSPSVGGANPDYTGKVVPVNYYRTIVDTTGDNRASFSIVFTGTFVSDATTDLANSDLEIFISRRNSAGGGNSGYDNTDLLEMHGSNYNFATFDDGSTDGAIREASSSGNTVNATFGGFSCEDGFFINIRINDATIKIDRLAVTFY